MNDSDVALSEQEAQYFGALGSLSVEQVELLVNESSGMFQRAEEIDIADAVPVIVSKLGISEQNAELLLRALVYLTQFYETNDFQSITNRVSLTKELKNKEATINANISTLKSTGIFNVILRSILSSRILNFEIPRLTGFNLRTDHRIYTMPNKDRGVASLTLLSLSFKGPDKEETETVLLQIPPHILKRFASDLQNSVTDVDEEIQFIQKKMAGDTK